MHRDMRIRVSITFIRITNKGIVSMLATSSPGSLVRYQGYNVLSYSTILNLIAPRIQFLFKFIMNIVAPKAEWALDMLKSEISIISSCH